MTIRKLPGSQIESNTITITQIQTTAVTNIVAQAGPRVSSLIYPGNDTAGNTVGGQTVYINGSGFETNNAIYINGNAVPSKSFISASNLSFTTPALAAGIYPVYVINTDSGATAIFVPGYISSAEPTWVTSAGSLSGSQDETTAWSYSLSTTGDAPITYALAAGSSLPGGISLAANGVISGTISSPTGNVTTYTFSVTATDAQNQDATRQFTVTTTTGEGVLFANNVLLIHADGTNNQNNHTFLDSSNNNFTITRNGNATQGSFSPFSQTGWSGYFDGSGDYLTYNAGSTLSSIGSGPLTIEAWVYYTGNHSGFHDIFITNTGMGMLLDAGKLRFYGFSATAAATNLVQNTWVHVAVVRQSSNVFGFVNGIKVLDTTTSTAFSGSTGYIGSWTSGTTENWPGYISNLRVSNSARYTANFTPSTTQFTSDVNTALLTLQSNRFIDNSNNNFTITRNGDVSIQAFSPFAPTAAYTTANVGGSGYFDGSGDYLTIADNAALQMGSGDFTIEYWWYPNSIVGNQTPYDKGYTGAGGLLLQTGNGDGRTVVYASGSAVVTSNTALIPNSWTHMALVRNGTNLTLYQNGISVGSVTNSTNFNNASTAGIGGNATGASFPGQYPINGYISNLRSVKGTAVYTAAFTPPTAPLTNIANTSLLCNFTNAGIFDQTAKNILETVGDAKVSTAQYKYGTGSMYFDGSGDYLSVPDNPLLELESGDFTIEAWIYVVSYVSTSAIITKGTGVSSPFLIYIGGSSEITFYASTTGSSWTISDLRFATNPATSTWHHIAVTRSGSTFRTFFNGTLANSTTLSGSLLNNSSPLWVGYYNAAFNGYIDDLRITKGYARYTSNFTPPTSALKDK